MFRIRFTRTATALVVTASTVGLAGLALSTPAGATAPWSVSHSPSTGSGASALNAVSCHSADSCQAVGYYTPSISDRSLIESWDGTRWSRSSSPHPGSASALDGVSCVSDTWCMAVGNYTNGTFQRTLTELWNGSEWRTVSSPNDGSYNNELSGVSCVSSTSCTSVGYYNAAGGISRTLVEHWNGTRWSLASSPNHGTTGSSLSGVSCVSSVRCTAVGSYESGTNTLALIESWENNRWSLVAGPSVGTPNSLAGVSCHSTSSCKAVGSTGEVTLIESWNGTKWSVSASPNLGSQTFASLGGVTCVSANSCIAVGYDDDENPAGTSTLVESWNGHQWTVASNGGFEGLSGVSCVPTLTCQAVGDTISSSGYSALIESNA
jgi:hypothetical protein